MAHDQTVSTDLSLHAVLDLALVVAGVFAPVLLGYSHLLWPTLYTLALAGIGLGLNSVTDYPIGIARILPFWAHRLIEFTSVIPFAAIPWMMFSDAGPMPWFTSVMGAVITLNALMTPAPQPG